MELFFLIIGSIMAALFVFAGGGANIGLGIICGLSFVAAAIVRLAHAIERFSESKQPDFKNRQDWSLPDKPVKEGGTGSA